MTLEVAKKLCVFVAHASHDEACGRALLCERAVGRGFDCARSCRDGISMRTCRRMAEKLINPLLKVLTDVVLKTLGLFMDTVPRKAHSLNQVQF